MCLVPFRWLTAALPMIALSMPAAAQEPARKDLYGQALPAGAIARLGVRLYDHPDAFTLALSPDGTCLATVGRQETRVWDTATAKPLHRLAAVGQSPVFSPDNRRLFLGTAEQGAVWDIAAGKELWKTAGQYGAFSPDGKLLAAVSFEAVERSFTIRLVDANGKELRSCDASPVRPDGLGFSGDGALLAAGCNDGFVRLWETTTGKEVRRLRGHRGVVHSVAFAPDCRQLASASADDTVRLWDLDSGKEIRQWNEVDDRPAFAYRQRTTQRVAFSPDGKSLYAAWKDGLFCRVYDPMSGDEIRQVRTAGSRFGNMLSPSGRFASVAGDSFGRTESLVRLWDLNTGEELGPVRPSRPLSSVAFSADGRIVATGSGDKLIYVWDAQTGKLLRRLAGHLAEVRTVAFAARGNLLASGSNYQDTAVNVWDAATGRKAAQLPGHPNGTDRMVFAPDGTLVVGCRSGLVRRWDVAAGKEIGRYQVPGNVFGLSPDGRLIAHGHRDRQTGQVEQHVIDLATGKPVHKIPAPADGSFFWTVLSPDATQLISYGFLNRPFGPKREHLFDLYDIATGKPLRRFGDDLKELDRASQPNWVIFSPDGRTVAEAQRAKTVRLWELRTGNVRCRLEGHTAQATAAAFSPDGRMLATAGADRTSLVWDVYGLAGGPMKLDANRLAELWNDLGDADAARGFRAIGTLARGGEPTLAFLKERLRPAAAPDAGRVARLIADLDAREFAERRKAEEELEKMGEPVIAPLRKALADKKPPLEVKKRLETLLQRLEGFPLSPDRLRQYRAVEALEVIGSPAARDIVRALAGGVPESRLTRTARATLDRLTRRASDP